MTDEQLTDEQLTDEQLDELVRLRQDAARGPWQTYGESWEDPDPYAEEQADYVPVPKPYGLKDADGRTLWSSGDGEYAYPDEATAKFILKMESSVIPMVTQIRELQEQLDYARELTCLTTVVGCGECQLCTAQRELAQTRRGLTETKLSLEGALDASAEGTWMARALDAERELKEAQAVLRQSERTFEVMVRNQNEALLDFDAQRRALEDLRKNHNEALRLLTTRVEASRLTEANEQIIHLRDTVQWMVNACKYECKPGSSCGICHMGLTALGLEDGDGTPTTEATNGNSD